EPNDNERTFFKKIRPLVKDQKYLNKIDKILRKDDLDLPENKKQRKLKNIKEDVDMMLGFESVPGSHHHGSFP
ncbi:3936_t:CDS:1, partial [Cetraspora pellucida]